MGEGRTFFPTQTTSRDPVPMEAEVMNVGSQGEGSWREAALGTRLRSGGGAAAMGLELLYWEARREGHGVA